MNTPRTSPVRLLTAQEFQATTGEPHIRVATDTSPPFDFWSYFDHIPLEHVGDHDFFAGQVANAWTTRNGEFQHVLIRCETPNVFLVIVLDLRAMNVRGHHVLDLNQKYGVA